MNSNLKWKAIFIASVILLCVYGLFGLPDFPTSWTAVKQNFSSRIKLGLDLQGGTHLILQVQVNEAVRQETDQAVAQLNKLVRDKNIPSDQAIGTSDSQIKITNVSADRIGDLRTLVTDSFPNWDIVPSPGEPNAYLLNLRPVAISLIQQHAPSPSSRQEANLRSAWQWILRLIPRKRPPRRPITVSFLQTRSWCRANQRLAQRARLAASPGTCWTACQS